MALQGARESLLLVRVLTVSPAVPFLLRLPLPRASRILSRRRRYARARASPDRVAVVVETAQVLGRPLVRSGCLTRAITLYWLLDSRQDPLTVCFGLGGPDDDYSGHCWLERGGQPYLERVDPRERFPVQYTIPQRAS